MNQANVKQAMVKIKHGLVVLGIKTYWTLNSRASVTFKPPPFFILYLQLHSFPLLFSMNGIL